MKDNMLEAIKQEIGLTATYNGDGRNISSIYFGGGTPSLLEVSEIQDLLLPIYNKFDVDKHAEITLEANPDDINPKKLEAWLDAGVYRLSLGVQTFMDEELTWMNRAHHAGEAIQAIKEIKQAGFILPKFRTFAPLSNQHRPRRWNSSPRSLILYCTLTTT